jgi:acyl-CoA dehydrogenase
MEQRPQTNGDLSPVARLIPGVPQLSITQEQGSLRARAEAVAAVAAANAETVDRDARFPAEAIEAMREQRLLSMQVPASQGGGGASVSDVVDVCYMLGRRCGSTAMIFAMHQIMVAILVRHGSGHPWHDGFLRGIADKEWLLASSTTDGKGGGDLRSSSCALAWDGSGFTLEKAATVVSYGAHADGILTTARRSADAPPSAQVLVGFLKGDYSLEQQVDWDTLGMRGTCSSGFTLRGAGDREQVLSHPYQTIHTHTMMPVANLTWAGVWSGIAASAVERARGFVRKSAAASKGQLPPGAGHLTRATLALRSLRGAVATALRRFESASRDGQALESLDFQTDLTLLKVAASEQAIATVTAAMQACGLSGYRNNGEFSVSRNLRDVLSSSIMINNDRILANAGLTASVVEVPATLRDQDFAL